MDISDYAFVKKPEMSIKLKKKIRGNYYAK